MMINVDMWMFAKSSQVNPKPAMRPSYLNVDDSIAIAMVQVLLFLRCLRISCMLILCFDLIHFYLSKVAHKVMIGYSLRCSKVVE